MEDGSVDKMGMLDGKRRRAGLRRDGADEPWSCDESPPALFYEGLEQFNRGEYFEQHESLEEIWLDEPRPLRRLYQGILKVGVGFYKLRLGNYRGTINHLAGGVAYLERFPPTCMGVDVARLIREASDVRERVVELGPERMVEFDLEGLPRVHYERTASSEEE